MTASIVSTLAGADTLTYLVCFAPLALVFLVAATEIIHEYGAVAIEALFDRSQCSQKRGFLDLPAEIRNVIYELISTPLADTQPYVCEQNRYNIQVDASTKFYLSRLGQTCRQIHEEYMSFLLVKHEVTFSSLRDARKWQVNIGKRFTTAVKRYTIKSNLLITKDPDPQARGNGQLLWAALPFLIVDLRAYYWTYAGVTYLTYVLFGPDEEEFELCAQSTSLVKSVLTAAPFDSSYFTFNHFLEMTSQISRLRLHGHQNRISNNNGRAKSLFPPSFVVDDQGLKLGYETKIEIGEDIFRPSMEN